MLVCDNFLPHSAHELDLDLHDVTLYSVTLIPQTPKERMCSIRISLLVITLPSHISHFVTSK